MNIDANFNKKVINLYVLSIIISLLFLVISYIYIRGKRQYYIKNWSKYKCKPYIIPFANYINTDNSGRVKSHFAMCLGKIYAPMIGLYTTSVKSIMGMIGQSLGIFSEGTNSIRLLFEKIRVMSLLIINELLDKIKPITLKIRSVLSGVIELVNKLSGLNRIITYILVTIAYSAIAIFNTIGEAVKKLIQFLIVLSWLILIFCCGPIIAILGTLATAAGLGEWTCFDENTEIIMSNGERRQIPFVKIGDNTMYGGKVTGVFKFSSQNTEMYNYKNVIVSGSHGVYDNGVWKHIEDCEDAIKIDFHKDFIYCISTENNKLFINDILFTDYYEVSNPVIVNSIRNKEIKYLNYEPDNYKNKLVNTDNYGFYYTTKIKMNDGNFKEIHKLEIGDKTNFGNIIGLFKLELSPDTILYKNKYYPDLIVAGTQLLRQNGNWICVYESNDFVIYNKSHLGNHIYHLLTDKGIIINQHYLFTDYNQLISCPDISNEIDETLLNYLNKNTTINILYKS